MTSRAEVLHPRLAANFSTSRARVPRSARWARTVGDAHIVIPQVQCSCPRHLPSRPWTPKPGGSNGTDVRRVLIRGSELLTRMRYRVKVPFRTGPFARARTMEVTVPSLIVRGTVGMPRSRAPDAKHVSGRNGGMCVGRPHTLPAEPCLAESAPPHTPTFLFPSPSKRSDPCCTSFCMQTDLLVNSEQRLCDKGRDPGRAGQDKGGGREPLGEKAGCDRGIVSAYLDGRTALAANL